MVYNGVHIGPYLSTVDAGSVKARYRKKKSRMPSSASPCARACLLRRCARVAFHSAPHAHSLHLRYDMGPLDPLVLFVGRLATQKGPDLLVEAVPMVSALLGAARLGSPRPPIRQSVRVSKAAAGVGFRQQRLYGSVCSGS